MEALENNNGLKGNLGVTGVVLMVLAQAAPLTVMAGMGPLMIGLGNGVGVPLTAVIVGVVLLVFAVGFVAMSAYIQGAGAFYAYIVKGMGQVTGTGSAAVAVLSYTLVLLAVEAFLSVLVKDSIERFTQVDLHWSVYAVAIVVIIGWFGYRNIEASAKVLGCALFAEIAIIVAADFMVVWNQGLTGLDLTPFSLSSFMSGSPGIGVLFAILCFVGFEATVVYREEVSNPNRTIPLATYIAIIAIVVLYCVSFYLTIIGIGLDQVVERAVNNTEYMYLDFVGAYLGKVAHDLATLFLITSLLAAALANHNVIARYIYVLGRSEVVHEGFTRVHPVYQSPCVASIAQTGVAVTLVGVSVAFALDPVQQVYTWGAAAGTLGYMLIITLTALSVVLFFKKNRQGVSFWSGTLAPAIAFLCLFGFVCLALTNLSALSGREGLNIVNVSIVGVILFAFVLGVVRGTFMKRLNPHKVARLASQT